MTTFQNKVRDWIAISALCLAPMAVTAQDSLDALGGGVVAPGQAEDFWTTERLMAAVPFDGIAADTEDFGRPLDVPPSDQALPDAILGPPMPAPVGSVQVVHGLNQWPYWAMGKLFFSRGLDLYNCTAAVSYRFNTIFTAAHCVTDPSGDLYSNMYFFREYDHPSVIPKFSQKISIESAWFSARYVDPNLKSDNARVPYDFAIMCGEDSSPVGLPLDLSGAVHGPMVSFGYPTNFNDSNELMYVQGQTPSLTFQTPDKNWGAVTMNSNPMGHGASGGPWIPTQNGTQVAALAGINSVQGFGHSFVRSPWFGPGFWAVTQNALTKC